MRLQILKQYRRALGYSVLTQILGSLTNFGITLFLVRTLSTAEFGLYGIAFAVILATAGLIGAFFGTPFTVNVPDVLSANRSRYAVDHAVSVMAGAVLLNIFGFCTFRWFGPSLGAGGENVAILGLAVGVGCVAYCFRDMLTRIAFAFGVERAVFVAALGNAGAIAFLLALVSAVGVQLTVGGALLVYGTGQVVGVAITVSILSLPWQRASLRGLCNSLNESWPNGRWSVLSSVAYTLRTQAYNFIVPAILGVSALGEINAARVLVTPALMALPPIKDVLLPRLADDRRKGLPTLLRVSTAATMTLAGGGLVYSVALLVFLPWVAPLALGVDHGALTWLVIAWSCATFAVACREGLSMSLQAAREFGRLLLLNTIFGVLSLVVCLVLSMWLAAPGAVWSIVIAELGLGLSLWMATRHWDATRARQ